MQDERNTSFSQEINVNSFNEDLSSSDRTGRLVETEVNQTRSSEDSKSLHVEQTHDRTGRPVADTAAVQDDSQVFHEANTLNVVDEVLRKRMEKSIVVHDENHEPMMVNEADMDFRIPGLPHSTVKQLQRKVPAFDNWFRKLRTTQIVMLFNKIYDRINILIFQSRVKTSDSGCWEHRIMWITRDGTQNAVHSMFIILEHWHRLLHVRALLA